MGALKLAYIRDRVSATMLSDSLTCKNIGGELCYESKFPLQCVRDFLMSVATVTHKYDVVCDCSKLYNAEPHECARSTTQLHKRQEIYGNKLAIRFTYWFLGNKGK